MCAAKSSFKRAAKSKKLKKFASLCSEESLDHEYKCVQRGRSAEQLSKLNCEGDCTKDTIVEDLDDDEILFPYDASNRLSQQVEVLLEENRQLRKSLVEAEARLRGVVSKCPPGMGNHGRASDLAASKIVELSKRVRELTADLEVAKMRCRTFELSSLTAAATPNGPEQQKEKAEDSKTQETEIKELTDKLSSANLKVCEYRNQCQQLKHELKMAHKALVSEVGEGVSVASVVSGGGSWRGRAQQIQTLQQRLSELSEKTSPTDTAEKEAKRVASAARVLEKELKAVHEKEVSILKDQLEERQRKLEAAKARTRVLENSLSELRGKMASLLDKTSHDDQLISALTAQLTVATDKSQERSATFRLEQHNKLLEQQLAEEKTKSTYLQSALQEKDQALIALEEKLADTNGTKGQDTADKTWGTPAETVHSNINCAQEYLGVAAEAEKVRLSELLAVTNRRLEQERLLTNQAQEMLRRERHKAARLETKLARTELERVGARNGYHNSSPHKATSTEVLNDELKCKVELLEEEVLYLQSRLSNVQQEKQEDLRIYTGMLENTRQVFLDSLKSVNCPIPAKQTL